MKVEMKKIKFIYISLGLLAFTACNDPEDVDIAPEVLVEESVALTAGSADFSNYVAVGASFTAGVSDNGLFIESQKNS